MADACDRFHALMHARLDGDISREDDDALGHHLDSCESCRSTFRSLRTSVAVLAAMPAPQPGPAFAAAVARRAAAAGRGRVRAGRLAAGLAFSLLGAAAGLLIGLWVGLVEPTLPGVLLDTARAGAFLWRLTASAGGWLPAVGRALVPIGDAVVSLTVEGVSALLPLYAAALAAVALAPLLSRFKRPFERLPVLTI
jgi:anti-sigma factor RsiW